MNLSILLWGIPQAMRVAARVYPDYAARLKEKNLTILSDDELKLKSVVDILQSKLIKRSVPLKALSYGPVEPSGGGTVRQVVTLRVGIDKENARRIVKLVNDTTLRVQVQIMEDQVRVSGLSIDGAGDQAMECVQFRAESWQPE